MYSKQDPFPHTYTFTRNTFVYLCFSSRMPIVQLESSCELDNPFSWYTFNFVRNVVSSSLTPNKRFELRYIRSPIFSKVESNCAAYQKLFPELHKGYFQCRCKEEIFPAPVLIQTQAQAPSSQFHQFEQQMEKQ